MRQCVIIMLMLIGITPSFVAISKKKSVTMKSILKYRFFLKKRSREGSRTLFESLAPQIVWSLLES